MLRIFKEPTPLATAVDFVTALRASPATTPLTGGERHWQVFVELCEQVGTSGNVVPDAFIAALAIEQGATLVTADRGFARFGGLRWEHPLD